MDRPLLYVLINKAPVAIDDIIRWGTWMEQKRETTRRVGYDKINNLEISTVFLGIDYGLHSGPPVLFETLVFEHHEPKTAALGNFIITSDRTPIFETMRRYSTWEDAAEGHAEAVRLARMQTLSVLK